MPARLVGKRSYSPHVIKAVAVTISHVHRYVFVNTPGVQSGTIERDEVNIAVGEDIA